jgi:hypothetical protein
MDPEKSSTKKGLSIKLGLKKGLSIKLGLKKGLSPKLGLKKGLSPKLGLKKGLSPSAERQFCDCLQTVSPRVPPKNNWFLLFCFFTLEGVSAVP